MSDDLNYLDELLPNPRRRYSSTSMLAQYEAVAAGLGLAMMTPYVVPPNSPVVRVLPEQAMATRTLWLAAPSDLLRLRRVRVVWDFLRAIVDAERGRFVA
jgi:DNA-binding transcriptional LysR family regulator